MNDRIQQQCFQQIKAYDQGLRTPQIFSTGYIGGHFYFEMQYIVGRTVANGILEGRETPADNFVEFISDITERHKHSASGFMNLDFVENKIHQISQRSEKIIAELEASNQFQTICDRVAGYSFSPIPISQGHGDLTLENIMEVSHSEFILIDFDQPGFNSYVLDVAKIYQDLIGQWCLRDLHKLESRRGQLTNASLKLRKLVQALDKFVEKNQIYPLRDTYVLAVLHLMRTLPYTQKKEVGRFILARCSHILDHLI